MLPVVLLKFVMPSALSPAAPFNNHVVPICAAFDSVISTMIASTCTCSRGMSIWLTTAIMSWRMRSGALMTSAFVPASAQIVTGPLLAAPPSAAAAPGLARATAPHRRPSPPNWAWSFVARSSASA